MEKYTIKRDGLPPLAFTGEQIASASNRIRGGNDSTRWTEVKLYRTQAGKYVALVERVTQWQGESDHRTATSKATAAEVIEWLKEGEIQLGSVSQDVIEQAAQVDPAFAAAWVEEVE
jgi:EXLDI family protein